jgi:hypothetical protein
MPERAGKDEQKGSHFLSKNAINDASLRGGSWPLCMLRQAVSAGRLSCGMAFRLGQCVESGANLAVDGHIRAEVVPLCP